VQKNVMTVLSQMLVKGEAGEGSAIFIDATGDKKGLKYEVVDPAVAEFSIDDKSYAMAATHGAMAGEEVGSDRTTGS
jgi:hypothetical protein